MHKCSRCQEKEVQIEGQMCEGCQEVMRYNNE